MEKGFADTKIKNASKIIVITGAESTGKSTLTKELAKYFNVPFNPEIARHYIEKLDKNYNYTDVENIARLQIEQLTMLKNSEHSHIFLDTWLIVTKIWFQVVYNKEPVWLNNEIKRTKIDLFLVCDTDLPWISDSVRENGGEMRNILQNKYIETIRNYNFNYKIIGGQNSERLNNAIQFLNELQ
jgi:NadR type nicotinamide-nucleotide adenylyltransferase